MRRLQHLGVFLLVATLLFGLPLHVAVASQMTRQDAGVTATSMRPTSGICPARHAQAGADLLCQMACATPVAVVGRAVVIATASTWRAVRHAPEAMATHIGATPPLDPFPPRQLPVA